MWMIRTSVGTTLRVEGTWNVVLQFVGPSSCFFFVMIVGTPSGGTKAVVRVTGSAEWGAETTRTFFLRPRSRTGISLPATSISSALWAQDDRVDESAPPHRQNPGAPGSPGGRKGKESRFSCAGRRFPPAKSGHGTLGFAASPPPPTDIRQKGFFLSYRQ